MLSVAVKRFLKTTPDNDYLIPRNLLEAEVCQPDMGEVPSAPNGTIYNTAELSLPSHLLRHLKQGSVLKSPGKFLKSESSWET